VKVNCWFNFVLLHVHCCSFAPRLVLAPITSRHLLLF
jgi:hypothetical protein